MGSPNVLSMISDNGKLKGEHRERISAETERESRKRKRERAERKGDRRSERQFCERERKQEREQRASELLLISKRERA